MKNVIYLLVFLFVWSCNNSTKKQQSEALTTEVVAEEVAILNVETLLEGADSYNGKEVQILGTVVHVCKHSGKRMHLLGQNEETRIRVEAGEIGKFDRELEGSEIIAKGIFRKEVIDEEYLAKWENEMKMEGRGNHESHEELEEEQGKMKRYRNMMKEKEGGKFEQFWIDGLSFEIVDKETAI